MRACGVRLAELGLQIGQDLLLRQLWQSGGILQSELTKRLRVEQPTVSKALRRLEKSGFISRRRDHLDARRMRVFLTARGERAQRPVEAIWTQLEAVGVDGLSVEEQEHLHNLARRVARNLERHNARRSPRRPDGDPL